MVHKPRVLSNRHFSWIFKKSDHAYSLNHLVYFVKDFISNTTRLTWNYQTHCRPLKAILHGFDITSFLTGKPNLTNYSFFFLSNAQSFGFTLKDVRDYFRLRSKAKPVDNKLNGKDVRKQSTPVSSDEIHISSPAISLFEKMKASQPVAIAFPQKKIVAYEDTRVLRAGIRLACLKVLKFKFPESVPELRQTLLSAGLRKNALLDLRYHLEQTGFQCTPSNLLELLGSMASAVGWHSSSGGRAYGEDVPNFGVNKSHLKKLNFEVSDLPQIMFPSEW